jgi:beta-lactamase class A
MLRHATTLFFLFALAVCGSADEPSLQSRVNGKISGFPGTVTLYAKNLRTGSTLGVEGEQPVRTASTIKLAIMTECFAEAAEGKVKLSEPIRLRASEKVSGSGILQEFSDDISLPLRDIVDLMIVLSDNTATNLILDRIGGNAVNERMATLGLTQTRVMRKILGDGSKLKSEVSGVTQQGAKPENKKWGIGRSSPREMVSLLERLYRGELVSKTASDEMLDILKRQRDRNGIGRDMKDITIASKSGALEHLRSDVGIIYSKNGPVAMAITIDNIRDVNWTSDNPALLLLSQLSEILVDELGSGPEH